MNPKLHSTGYSIKSLSWFWHQSRLHTHTTSLADTQTHTHCTGETTWWNHQSNGRHGGENVIYVRFNLFTSVSRDAENNMIYVFELVFIIFFLCFFLQKLKKRNWQRQNKVYMYTDKEYQIIFLYVFHNINERNLIANNWKIYIFRLLLAAKSDYDKSEGVLVLNNNNYHKENRGNSCRVQSSNNAIPWMQIWLKISSCFNTLCVYSECFWYLAQNYPNVKKSKHHIGSWSGSEMG